MARMLIIDDELSVCKTLCKTVTRKGHEADYAQSLKHGLSMAETGDFDLVLLDVRLPDGSGLNILNELRESASKPEVIIITGEGDPEGAELAIKNGAWDYLQKPLSLKEIDLTIGQALEYRNEKFKARRPVALDLDGIVGKSQAFRDCLDQVAASAVSDSPVLISGETGTGKEVIARAIHKNSRRADKQFVVVDCAALPGTLAESILFGHKKGSFTGAVSDHEGLVRIAHGGTLFLDEIGEMSLALQKVFLRVLEERVFRPVGSKDEFSSDFRLLAATNRDLDHLVSKGEFRQDLLFRVRSLIITLPPLRRRPEDVKELTMHYLPLICESQGTGAKRLSPHFLDALTQYNWPGNVRELIHTLERAVAAAHFESTLYPKHLPTELRVSLARDKVSRSGHNGQRSLEPMRDDGRPVLWKTHKQAMLDKIERTYFEQLLLYARGDVKLASEISGLTRARIYDLIKKHNLSKTGR